MDRYTLVLLQAMLAFDTGLAFLPGLQTASWYNNLMCPMAYFVRLTLSAGSYRDALLASI